MNRNLLLNTDSYKASHFRQYPPGTTNVYSYIESRGGKFDRTLFFGLQMFLRSYLSRPISVADVHEAGEVLGAHGLPFNREGWEYILRRHEGKLPLLIKAVPEGTVLPTRNVLVTVENTDENVPWLTSYMETALVRAVWYPTTVATNSYACKQSIRHYLEKTCDDPEAQLLFRLHDFGARGVSSQESAAIGGAAHLVNFMGTDTLAGIMAAREHYGADMAGFSIPAAEHSTITAWGREHEIDAFSNMVTQFGKKGAIFAVVSDSYDIYAAIETWGTDPLRQRIIDSGATLVVRPDSGEPEIVVLRCVLELAKKFGTTTNKKGYAVLNPCIRVIQGDGIDLESMRVIMHELEACGISIENVAFGMGGGLLQQMDRDTMRFAMKCSAVKVNGKWRDVYKDPVTDSGKTSKRGRLALITETGRWDTVPQEGNVWRDCLQTVYKDGVMAAPQMFSEIRERANRPMLGEES